MQGPWCWEGRHGGDSRAATVRLDGGVSQAQSLGLANSGDELRDRGEDPLMSEVEQHEHAVGNFVREEIRDELETVRVSFHELIDSLTDDDWHRPSGNPAWTIGQVAFHMTLAPRMLPADVRMIRKGWRIPKPPASLFNRLNVLLTRLGARKVTRKTAGEAYDAAHAVALEALDTIGEDEWDKGLDYPGWDPLLSGHVTLERLFRYLRMHFQCHAEQIRAAMEAPDAWRDS